VQDLDFYVRTLIILKVLHMAAPTRDMLWHRDSGNPKTVDGFNHSVTTALLIQAC